MKYDLNKIYIPIWISCRTFFQGEEKSRTYISNEKRHVYVQLDGLASDMWGMIYNKTAPQLLYKWAESKNVAEEIEQFIEELVANELICVKDGNRNESDAMYDELEASTNEEEKSFFDDMKDWFFDNKLLFSVFFELTYRCDLKCVHCYNPKNMSDVELDIEKCKKTIDNAYEAGCFRVIFSGGEATLHSRFIEVVKYAKSKHLSVEIFTNGQRLSKDFGLYKQLLSLYPYRIGISLYSMEEKKHEQVTQVKGSFRNTYELICSLRQNNVNVQIKNFLLNINCMDCIQVKKWAEEKGATSNADLSLIPTIEGDKKTMKYMLDEDELFALYTDRNSPIYGGDFHVQSDYSKIMNSSPCYGGFSGLCINPDGKVTICVSMPISLGNVNETSLREIWQMAMQKNPQSQLYQWQKVTIADCKECYKEDYCAFCSYCPGMGYLENGYLKKSDVLCNQAKVKKKAYEYLQEKGQILF